MRLVTLTYILIFGDLCAFRNFDVYSDIPLLTFKIRIFFSNLMKNTKKFCLLTKMFKITCLFTNRKKVVNLFLRETCRKSEILQFCNCIPEGEQVRCNLIGIRSVIK